VKPIDLFRFDGKIGRSAYLTIGLTGVFLKDLVDIALSRAFGREWQLENYLLPLGSPVPIGSLTDPDLHYLIGLLAASIPFAWVGLAVTAKRFRAIGWPLWLVVLFFVPVANIASFALAAAWPEASQAGSSRETWLARIVPADRLGSAVFALLVTAALGTGLVALSTRVMYSTGYSYGWGLFAALPFIQGAVAAYAYGVHERRSLRESAAVAIVSMVVTTGALIAFALEGFACIVMAAPIAFAFAFLGALFGHALAGRSTRPNVAASLVCLAFAPALMGAEAIVKRPSPVYEVTTSVDIDAPPAVVWKNVVSFPDLPPPTELAFRVGIAYPMRAKIAGRGAGAIRYCEFSTGNFVEPVTLWQPGRRLSFDVIKSPEPMREWSPYGTLDTPHLHDYMISRHGEFVLTGLSGGRTRLTGRTWYQHHLWPAAYWAIWSDAIVHQIHYRVLAHIKTLSEKNSPRNPVSDS
jgi:uncharacterized membrane protein YhaH (DUF805 family)